MSEVERLNENLYRVFDNARIEDWDGTSRFQHEFANVAEALIAAARAEALDDAKNLAHSFSNTGGSSWACCAVDIANAIEALKEKKS